jgi:hypothetical protein
MPKHVRHDHVKVIGTLVPCRGLSPPSDDISEDNVAYGHRRLEDRGQRKVECDELRHGVLLT